MATDKEKIESMCRKAGMKPFERRQLRDYDLLISDGFSMPPHYTYQRFGVDPDDFPNGCYVTFWWLMKGEDNMFAAHPLFCDIYHDMEYDKETKHRMRLNSAVEDAENFLKQMDEAAKELETIH